MSETVKKEIVSWIGVFFGTLLMSAGFVYFINPYNIIPGGVYGCSIVLHNIFPTIQVGWFGYMFDIPLLILATILLPLSVEGVFSGMVYNFARGVGTVSAVIFLVSFKTPLASIAILNLAEQGDWGKSAALALVLTIITFSILALGKALSSRLATKGKTDGK